MKPKTMILMGLAITCGLGASYMTSRLLAERQPTDEPEKIEILVARRNLSVGDRIKIPEELFEKKLVVAEGAPPDAIKEFDKLKEKIMKQHLRKGDHITEGELYGNGDSLPIPEGYKAVGLRVNLDSTASGFATLPHSRVNLLLTVKGPDFRTSFCQVLLQDVLVLAADARTDRDGSLVAPASVVTFALKDEDCLKVMLAKEMGPLTLSLRKPSDRSSALVTKVTGDDVVLSKKADEKKESVSPPPEIAAAPKVEPKPEPPPSAPKAEPEAPKGKLFTLDIHNGRNHERVQTRVDDNGNILEESNGGDLSPPRPRATPKKNNNVAEDI